MGVLISVESLEKAVAKIDNLDEDSLEKLSETYTNQQPELIGYILSSGIEYENDTLMELLIYYYMIFTEAVMQQGLSLQPINDEMIDAFQEEYLEVMEEYMNEENFEVIDSFCNQNVLLYFLMQELEMEDEDGEKIDEETGSLLFMVGIALISIIDRNIREL